VIGLAPDPALTYGGIIGLITAAGLEDDFVEEASVRLLAKALPQARVPRLPREVALLQTVRHLVATYVDTIRALQANVAKWFEMHFPSVEKSLSKALPDGPLDAAKIEELRLLITSHFKPAPASPTRWSIPTETWNLWQTNGIVIPGLPLPAIADAYVAGRLYQVLTQATDFDTMKRMAAQIPAPRTLALAEAWAQQRAAETVRGFGERLAAKAVATALSTQQRIIRNQTADYLRTGLVEGATPKDFARDLYHVFSATDAERDWQRVAVSEIRVAHNVGRVQAMEEDNVEQMYMLTQPTACRHCRALYLEPDGTPRIFEVRGFLDTITETGGTNIGRLASLLGDEERGWLPNALAHPWCQCRPMPVVQGHKLLRIIG